ncbi:FAD-dependent oxidoreductase [Lentzea tibetensis]|uniref:FAD-dependent oxidoreductase n=1 Tax=Lentzea tibetensis TaxID=2591470 RepID=UPI001F339F26|nr:FAD-dependent oxidoreductase [Lentzea tibetensis]
MSEFDVVIVGSGAAGLVAALTVAGQGLKPLVLEKSDLLGGSSALSGGGLWVPANPLLRGTDSADDALRYLQETAGEDSSQERRTAFVRSGPDMVAFLLKAGLRLRWSKNYPDYHPNLPGGSTSGRCVEASLIDGDSLGPWLGKLRLRPGSTAMPFYTTEIPLLGLAKRTPRGFLTALRVAKLRRIGRKTPLIGGASLIGQLVKLATDRGAEIWLNAKLEELVVHDSGVTGVVVSRDGRPEQVDAARGVLLAAGGFAHNDDMRQKSHPQPTGTSWTMAAPTDTGEAISLGVALGAATALMDEAWWGPALTLPNGMSVVTLRERSFPGSIIVDSAGERFMNESASYNECGHRIYERGSVPSWLIIDDKHRSRYPFVMLKPGDTPEIGLLHRAPSLTALAEKIGVPAERLERTVARFNGFAASGADADFHRGDTAYDRFYGDPRVKPNPNLGALDTAPYYAAAIYPGDLGTKGGLVTDEHARVLREDGSPIEGLYAAGNTTASVMGRSYPGPGCTLGAAAVFAYLGAQHLCR